MIDPRTGAAVFARYAIVPSDPEEGKRSRPCPRMLKCVWDGKVTMRQLYRRLQRILDRAKLCEEYFSLHADERGTPVQSTTTWGEVYGLAGGFRWLACFAVTGANEGHYVHVELLRDDKRLLLFLGKTFRGMESACQAASLLATLLGA